MNWTIKLKAVITRYEIHSSVFLFKAHVSGAIPPDRYNQTTTLITRFSTHLKSVTPDETHIQLATRASSTNSGLDRSNPPRKAAMNLQIQARIQGYSRMPGPLTSTLALGRAESICWRISVSSHSITWIPLMGSSLCRQSFYMIFLCSLMGRRVLVGVSSPVDREYIGNWATGEVNRLEKQVWFGLVRRGVLLV